MEHDDYEEWVRELIAGGDRPRRRSPLSLVRFPVDAEGAFTVTWFYRSLRRIEGLDTADRLVSLWTAFDCIIAGRYGKALTAGKEEKKGRGRKTGGRLPLLLEDESELLRRFHEDPYWTETLKQIDNGDYVKCLEALRSLCPVKDEAGGVEATVTVGGVKEIIEVVHAIRKNLFRGRSGPDDISPRDAALFRSSFALLLLIVTQHLLKTGVLSSERAFSIEELMDGTDLHVGGRTERPKDRSALQL